MKKGFTLIELLAVIVIIGVVALIAVPAVNKNIIESKEKLYEVQVEDITLAGQKWATDNAKELDSEFLNDTYVSVEMLQTNGYLPNEKIKDPRDNSKNLNGCVKISYDVSNKNYKYSYEDDINNCKNGFYYDYNISSKSWIKNTSKQKLSVASYLIGDSMSNVVASGSGLYDMEDRYVFRGDNISNNYVKIGNNSTLFRIMSIDKNTKTLKLVRTSGNSAVWDSNGNVSFDIATIHTENLDKKTDYNSIINSTMKWNSGSVEVTDNLNVDAARTYEKKNQITMNVGLISLSEYMESSLNDECNSGTFASCSDNNYLKLSDAWMMTTSSNSVYYVDTGYNVALESDLKNAHHNIYDTIYVKSVPKNGEGTISSPFIISIS